MKNLGQQSLPQKEKQDTTEWGLEEIIELSSSEFVEEENEKECFSEPTLKAISKLGDVLNRIDKRMKLEGYSIKYGKIVKNENP